MRLIQNNPYRTIGILVGATAREQNKQVNNLKMLLGAAQEPKADFSFSALGKIVRTVNSVTEAASKLNLDSDKMNAALFWFYNGNPITDEPAFDALKDGEKDVVIEIWRKLAYNSQDNSYNLVNKRNASAFHNLSTFYLQEYGIDEDTLQLRLRLLESDYFNELKNKATDETFKISKVEMQLLFLNSLMQQENFDSSKLIEAISNINFSAKADFMKGFVQKPIEQIEKLIEETRKKQKANAAKAGEYGNELFRTANPLLTSIVSILGRSDIKVISISDKLANEILQCSIEYFNHFHETGTEVGEIALDLIKKVKSIALGSVVKERINENISNVERYVKDRPEREKQSRIKSDIEGLIEILKEFERKSSSIENARALINRSKPKLANIKSVLGSTDGLYLGLSTKVAMIAHSYIIEEVNEAQKNLDQKIANDRYGTINRLRSTFTNALAAYNLIGTLDMEYDFKINSYNKNKEALKGLCDQLEVRPSTSSIPTGTFRPPASSSDDGVPYFIKVIGFFLVLIFLAKACN